MSECFSKTEFDFLDRDIATDDGNLVKALREVRSLKAERDQLRESVARADAALTEGINNFAAMRDKCISLGYANHQAQAKCAEALNGFQEIKVLCKETALATVWRSDKVREIQDLAEKHLEADSPGQALLEYMAKLERVRDAAAAHIEDLHSTDCYVALIKTLAACPKEGM